jgi:hypothetical protein
MRLIFLSFGFLAGLDGFKDDAILPQVLADSDEERKLLRKTSQRFATLAAKLKNVLAK